jgi:hypothetical protein
MPKVSCEDVRRSRGEDPAAIPALSAHVAECPRCRDALALRLDREFLQRLLAPLVALGAAWGLAEDASLIAEAEEGPFRVALYVRPRGPELWALSVVISPPVHAIAVLRFGQRTFRAPFDQSGTATVAAVPVELIVGAKGPPLRVTIESYAIP